MLLELAAAFNDHRFERAAEDAWYLKLVTPESCATFLAVPAVDAAAPRAGALRTMGVGRGTPRARRRRATSSATCSARSAWSVSPNRSVNTHSRWPNGEVIHLDLAWPDVLPAVEPGHSHWHRGVLKTRADMARDHACSELGWQVLRYDEAAQTDLAAVGRELQRIHRARVETVRRPSHHV